MKLIQLFTLFLFMGLLFAAGPVQAQTQEATESNPFLILDQSIQTINSFTITPNTAQIGTSVTFNGEYDVDADQTAFCFYFAAADLSGWDANFTALGSIAGLDFTKRPASACPPVAGFGSIDFYTTDTSAAIFGDTFEQSVVVPSIGTGTKIIAVRQYEGSDCETGTYNTGDCAFVNFRSITNFVVQPEATTVHADPAGVCAGNSPCFTSLQTAIGAVAVGGTVNVYGTFAAGVSIDKDLTLQSPVMAAIGDTVTVTDGANVTIRGLNLSGDPGINVAAGNATAYANNIVNGVSGTGDFGYNWWGVYDSDPGATGNGWATRLGAAVEAYGIGSLGQASVTGGTGTAVVISHGRGHENAPFGQATVEDGNTQCSDYYDVFVQAGSGTWQVSIPIDSGTGCDSVYQARLIAMLNMAPQCTDGSQIGGCWDSALDYGTSITQISDSNGRRLRVNGLETSALQGTPFVSGNQDDLGPTAVTLQGLQIGNLASGWIMIVVVTLGLLLTGAAVWVNNRRVAQ